MWQEKLRVLKAGYGRNSRGYPKLDMAVKAEGIRSWIWRERRGYPNGAT